MARCCRANTDAEGREVSEVRGIVSLFALVMLMCVYVFFLVLLFHWFVDSGLGAGGGRWGPAFGHFEYMLLGHWDVCAIF